MRGEAIRVRGLVQGVGFRPTVWHLAKQCELVGEVWNDAEGVLIHAWGEHEQIDRFLERLNNEAPPLSRIEAVERTLLDQQPTSSEFTIIESQEGEVLTGIVPDAATCSDCLADVLDKHNRRYRYPFTNCTHCGPRLSIIRAIPYDRANTSMSVFPQCTECQSEYEDPADRRFHAQPNACGVCGPQVWLEDASGERLEIGETDVIEQAVAFLEQGKILAIKGIGGVHLACDAMNAGAVDRLRQRKQRYHKAFALMARDLNMVQRFAKAGEQEAELLRDSAAPIVVLDAEGGEKLAPGVAPNQNTLGFMLPYTPLHHLLMQSLSQPIVLTSGNRSDEPQCTDNGESRERLNAIADVWLLHDREIVNRLDDSVVRVADGQLRMLRRARGYAPAPLKLPAGFEQSPALLAYGGELKNTFCLVRDGKAYLSQHMGDLEDLSTHQDYRHNLALYQQLFDHHPELLVVDKHPDYLSTQWGREEAQARSLPLQEVQHHHAHIAACMAEHGLALDTQPVLGVALDGLGFGDDGAIWGGEFLLVDYRHSEKLAGFQPVAMLGGAKAMYEPWRNTYAHLVAAMGWDEIARRYADLPLVEFLSSKPLENLDIMMERGLNCPLASSAGRLFDAVAAAVGVCRDSVSHEGQAAIELEAMADKPTLLAGEAYGFDKSAGKEGVLLGWLQLWHGILDDLRVGVDPGVISARFHQGLANAVVSMVLELCEQRRLNKVVLSGGVFQNRLLLELTSTQLREEKLTVLSPSLLPANDGGISYGQAVVAAARYLSTH
ncbi:MAG: carbamoyltransferase HypF [Chromatiales bacterium]|nr:carbamoyltransferase HypF [Chromatiales bacterium]